MRRSEGDRSSLRGEHIKAEKKGRTITFWGKGTKEKKKNFRGVD